MGNSPRVSIIMPTLNSEKTIRASLESIKNQDFDQNLIEILVVDGGSTDKTREIAEEYNCRIVENPKIQPECAKHVGILNAVSKYAIFLDSDEVFEKNTAIKERIGIMEKNKEIKMVLTGGYKSPAGISGINDYLITFSDPFSFFMYGISPDSRYYFNNMVDRYHAVFENDGYAILNFKNDDVLPLVDVSAGNSINLEYLREKYGELVNDVNIIPKIFYLLIKDIPEVAVLKKDSIIHYSNDSFKRYLRKLKWRVIINIHYTDKVGVGFSNRESFQPKWFRFKKYLFFPYALSLIWPITESVYYSASRKKAVLLLHLPLTIYVAYTIVYQSMLKSLGIRPSLMAYGNSSK